MPIYEFYCKNCNKILNFFSRRVNTATIPGCPHCGAPLSKEVSHIAIVSGGENDFSDELGDAPFDESRMESALEKFGSELESVSDTEDPRRAAELMRQFSEASGLRFNEDIQDAMDRIAKGEDPDAVSAEMDALIDSGADPFVPEDRKHKRHTLPPTKDPTLYDM